MSLRGCASILLAFLVAAVSPAHAQSTVTYTYDELGRLVTTSESGGPNNGTADTIAYDPAGNRTNFTSNGSVSTPTLSISGASANEGSSLSFTVTRTGPTAAAVGATWVTSNGTAIAGTNYTTSGGTVSFAAGVSSATVTVPTLHDGVYTPNLTMTVMLSAPTGGAVLGTASATGTIVNTDAAANLAIAPASANEGTALSFAVTRSGNTGPAVSAHWATSNGTAVAGTNYTTSSGTISFAAGVTTAMVSVPTIDDHAYTSALTMTTSLSAPSSGATIGTANGTGTINNIDPAPWTSSLTAATTSSCYMSFCWSFVGYTQDQGSMSNTSYNGYTIFQLGSSLGQISLGMLGSASPPNSGWTSITIPGIGTLTRAAATYSASPAYSSSSWTWTSSATVTSGTVIIQ